MRYFIKIMKPSIIKFYYHPVQYVGTLIFSYFYKNQRYLKTTEISLAENVDELLQFMQ